MSVREQNGHFGKLLGQESLRRAGQASKRGVAMGLSFMGLLVNSACTKKEVVDTITQVLTDSYTLSGSVTYDWVPAQDGVSTGETSGGVKLTYDSKAARPVRRATVQAVESSTSSVVASTSTDDLGAFSLSIPSGKTVTLRVLATSTVTSSLPDSTAPNYCSGASWDIRLVNNVTNSASSQSTLSLRPQYALGDSTPRSSAASGISLHAAATLTGSTYTSRAAAPFAILDSLITQIEMICQAEPTVALPTLYVKWSADNTSSSGNKYAGNISTSHYTREASESQLYILGKEGVDTDEYDDHVIAHEFGHYLEDRLYRSDSIGGSHSLSDSLDPRVAFGEGYGNAISGMTFSDPYYVDTSGSGQASGFTIRVSQAPTGHDRGVYSERSAQYFLWSLFDNRDSTANTGNYDRIHNIMKNYQKTTPAFTSLQSFAAYYNAVYGASQESLQTLWGTGLGGVFNSLCEGTCSGIGDTADPFDLDNDLGSEYASNGRLYKQSGGSTFGAEFWRLYRTLSSGTNTANAHDQTALGGYADADAATNKFGFVRWYRYKPSASGTVTVTFNQASCGSDTLDASVYNAGTLVASDASATGCPSLNFSATANTTYTFMVRGYSAPVTSWDVVVTP